MPSRKWLQPRNPCKSGWARLGLNQRPLACEARDQNIICLLITLICILTSSVPSLSRMCV